MKLTLLLCICLSSIGCAQNHSPDTAEAFAKRLLKAISSPTRDMFEDEIIISKKEHRAFCEMKVRIIFFYSGAQDEDFLEQQADEMHEFDWTKNQGGFRFQFPQNWNPVDKNWTEWEGAVLLEAEIDTSATRFEEDYAKNRMKNIELGFFTATFHWPDDDSRRKISTVVFRLDGGRWKVVQFINFRERK